jgi:hypothetical protein
MWPALHLILFSLLRCAYRREGDGPAGQLGRGIPARYDGDSGYIDSVAPVKYHKRFNLSLSFHSHTVPSYHFQSESHFRGGRLIAIVP